MKVPGELNHQLLINILTTKSIKINKINILRKNPSSAFRKNFVFCNIIKFYFVLTRRSKLLSFENFGKKTFKNIQKLPKFFDFVRIDGKG